MSGANIGNVVTRAYEPGDRAGCMAVFDSNVPRFLAPEENVEFLEFLDRVNDTDCRYLVLTQGGAVIACGGVFIEPEKRSTALSWGMVDRALHGQKLGTRLIKARLALVREIPAINEVTLSTSQHTHGFYAGFGFVMTKVTPDGFAPGLDRWDMVLRLEWRR